MIRKNRRLRLRALAQAKRPELRLEHLEDRRLMAADLTAAATARILVGYEGDQTAIVRHVNTEHTSVSDALAALRSDPRVRYAEVDHRVEVAATPNDPRFSDTWGLHSTSDIDIDAPEAWNATTGSSRTAVAVIDSGIDYAHPDLYQNIWLNQGEIPAAIQSALSDTDGDNLITFRDLNNTRNQGVGKITDLNANGRIDGGDVLKPYRADGTGGWADGSSNDGDRYVDDLIGWNFADNTNDPYDDNGHGTHVAGTIGASANNGIGVAGILWNVQLVGLKFMDASGSGYTSAALGALNYAVAKSIPISNNSWGGGGYSQAMYDAINNARTQGHIFVAAAGNGGLDSMGDNNDLFANYPSNYNLNNIIAVAATDRNDRLASFSNYGATTVDIAAPGVSILSTVPGGGYSSYSGTSMAAPHVAGVAGLVWSQNPTWTYSQVVDRILSQSDSVAGLEGKVATGGRLNAAQALASTSSLDPAPSTESAGPRIVSSTLKFARNGSVNGVRVAFNEAISPTSFTTADVTGFTGPKGALTIRKIVAVSGSGNKQFDLRFSTSGAGDYSMHIGPDLTDSSGTAMDQDQDGVFAESLDDRYAVQFTVNPAYTYSATPNAAIRDRYATPVRFNVDRDFHITDVNVKIDVTHTYDGDLVMYLTSPDGTSVDLAAFRGGSGDDFRNTVFNDETSTAISSGAAPFSGSYRPEQSLSAFDDMNGRGTWTLWVEDWYDGYTGQINSASITFASVESSDAAASASAYSDPALVARTPTLSETLDQASSTLEQTFDTVVNRAKQEREQVVDTLFSTFQQRRDELKSVRQQWEETAATWKPKTTFSWGSAVDQFMSLLTGK